jgi:hypothetical protein
MLVKQIVDYTLIDYERVWDITMDRVFGIIAEMQHHNKLHEERIKEWRSKH